MFCTLNYHCIFIAELGISRPHDPSYDPFPPTISPFNPHQITSHHILPYPYPTPLPPRNPFREAMSTGSYSPLSLSQYPQTNDECPHNAPSMPSFDEPFYQNPRPYVIVPPPPAPTQRRLSVPLGAARDLFAALAGCCILALGDRSVLKTLHQPVYIAHNNATLFSMPSFIRTK